MSPLTRFAALSSLALAAVACAAPSDAPGADGSDEEAVGQTEEALTSCGTARYAAALAHYKNAVQWSKDRERYGVCQSENGFLWSIADEASRAVMTCSAFRTVIRTSPWAAPVRRVLAPSLTLRSITGELLVIKDSQWANWTDTERFFDKGLTFWARAEGAYGSAVRIDFRADGKATWGELVYDEATGDISWRSLPATYTIAKTTSKESGPRRVTVTRAGKTQVFTLGVQSGWQYNDAPLFVLQPSGGTAPVLYSLVSECDA